MAGEQYQYTPTRALTMESLLADIAHELGDERYEGRTHARNDVYRDGCRGPLCRYRERTRKREARDARTRASLPGGVQPVRRNRCEQDWDNVIEATLEEIRALGAQHWLDSRVTVREAASVPPVVSATGSDGFGPVHQEGASACGDAVAMHLLPHTPPRVPAQRGAR